MGLPNLPYDNKKHYDAGRLRNKIKFFQDITTEDQYGGSQTTESLILETFAGKEEMSEYMKSQLLRISAEIVGGTIPYNQLQYFVIRNRKGFFPAKDMKVEYNNIRYIVINCKELDDPCTFLKVLVSSTV